VRGTGRLIDIAAAVSDGAVVNWGRTASESDPAERDLIGHLRLLERIASVHAALPPVGVFERSLHDSLWRSASVRPTSPPDAPTTWGTLTIEARLGSGTYADVYRARDPRLDRPVALKLLRHRDGDTAVETDTIEEARLLARVRHPNVVTVYGAERIDGRVGIWMEVVDGSTLEQDLRDHGPFTAEELVHVGTALCRALSAVHGAGLLHRDVKAQNVMRDADGRVLLTDFGTGRELAGPGAPGELAGTPLYLAPEVLNGEPASAVSDVYSLGVLLYHLATGSFPVNGRSLRDLREAHARGSQVPLIQARPDLPERLASVIDRAAAPDIGRRHESCAALETALTDAVDLRASRRRARAIVVALVVTLGCLLAGYAVRRWLVQARSAQPGMTLTQLTFNSAELTTFAAAISPDGKYLAYADRTGLVLKTVSSSQEHRISLPADIGVELAWLPDSSGLLAAGPSGVWRTSALLDPPHRVFSTGGRMSVSPTGLLAIVHGRNIGLARPNGEEVRQIADPDPRVTVSEPFWSPDGRRIGYIKRLHDPSGGYIAIETQAVDGGEATVLLSSEKQGQNMTNPVWTPDGRVLFGRSQRPPKGRYQDLWGIRINAATGRALSDPVSLWQAADFTFNKPSLTADGKSLVFLVNRRQINVYVADFDPIAVQLTGLRRAVLKDSENFSPSWTRDSKAIVFTSSANGSGTPRVYRQDLAQGDPREFPVSSVGDGTQTILSPDNTWLLYISDLPRTSVMRVRAAGGTPEPLFKVPSYYSSLVCAQTALNVCVVGYVVDGHLKLTVFDPAQGERGREYQLPATDSDAGPDLALSPDGREILSLDETGSTAQPRLLNLSTGNVRHLDPQPWTGVIEPSWTAAGKGWIVVKPTGYFGSEVLYIDRDGRSRHLWASTYQRLVGPMVSPDGRHIVFQSGMTESAVWMLQGF
jgi:Tol biopolymer transport system component